MKTYILPLADPHADLETVGGKGMSLAKLANSALPVPDGFHVTTEAYRLFVHANDLQAGILAALQDVDTSRPAALETASAAIIELFAQAEIPAELAGAIVQAYATLPGSNPAVAVRSSATAEDLPGASFAGQQDTYLNITGADKVLEATRKCWASLWTARAIGYRTRQNIPPESVALAVVVQLLVNAEAAGILFTANPLNGDRDQIVINAAWGLGEAIVGGLVTPDTLILSKPEGKIVHRDTAEKLVMTVRTPSGTTEQPVPDSLRKVPALSDELAARLAGYGVQIEKLYGTPMDIEWALADGKFAIVQARPVTALPEKPLQWTPPDPKGVYMRTSVVDLLPEPLSPLFVSLGIPTLVRQMQPLGARLTHSRPVLAADYFAAINNYAYMNAAFPSGSWWWIITGLLPAYPRMLSKLVPVWRDQLLPEYRAQIDLYKEKTPAGMSTPDLWQNAQKILDAAMYYVCGLMFATMGASAGSEGLLTWVYNKIARREGDPDATVLLMGWDNIPVRSEKSLYDLAMWCRERPGLADAILASPAAALSARLKTGQAPESVAANVWAELQARFDRHMEQFGHIIFQLDFAAPLPVDNPDPLLENIKMYLRGEGTNPYERQQKSEERRRETAAIMHSRLKGIKHWMFAKALSWGQSLAEVREDALAEIGLGYPILRAILRELGQRLVQAGAIEQPEDIFWLEKDEVENCIATLERGDRLDSLAVHVTQRKAFNQKAKRETPPPMMPMKKTHMGFSTKSFLAEFDINLTGQILKGVATSSGKVTAPARVLHGPQDFDQMRPGDILVAGTTTPAWTPLFAMASAVVTDIGGPLSHGSIVAREYGIPAVMGTGVATRRIHSGQMVTVDGSKGEVILENTAG